jgi:hypothetical protein
VSLVPLKGGRPLPTEQPAIASRRSVPTRIARFTGAGPQPCAAALRQRPYPVAEIRPPLHPPVTGACSTITVTASGPSCWGTWTRTKNLVHQRHLRYRIAPYPIDLAAVEGTSRKYAGRDSNPHTTRFELASFPGLALPARAPPQDRTGYPSIKSRVLHRYSSRRLERMAGVEPAWPGWKPGA